MERSNLIYLINLYFILCSVDVCCNGVLDVGEELDGGGVAEGDPLMITYLEQVPR